MEVPSPRTNVERFQRLDAAFRAGNMAVLRRELSDVEGFPNVIAHPAIGASLPYAIHHSSTASTTYFTIGGSYSLRSTPP